MSSRRRAEDRDSDDLLGTLGSLGIGLATGIFAGSQIWNALSREESNTQQNLRQLKNTSVSDHRIGYSGTLSSLPSSSSPRQSTDNAMRNRQEGEGDGWKILASVGGGLLAGVGAGMVTHDIFQRVTASNHDQEDDYRPSYQSTSRSKSPPLPRGRVYVEEVYDEDNILIAVDATVQRAGGLLILPETRQIYFYSIYWKDIFTFPDSDKFEMVNALLALEIFEEYVKEYRNENENEMLYLKTDSTFCTSKKPTGPYSGVGNEKFKQLYGDIKSKLAGAPFRGEWKYVDRSKNDAHMKMADKLSRIDCSNLASLPEIIAGWNDDFDDYTQTNISVTDYAVVHSVAMQLPNALLY